jgi:signal transduction histidine kinase
MVLLGVVAALAIHHAWEYRRNSADPVRLWAMLWCGGVCAFLLGRHMQLDPVADDPLLGMRVMSTAAFTLAPVSMLLCRSLSDRTTGRPFALVVGVTLIVLALHAFSPWFIDSELVGRVDASGAPFSAGKPGPLGFLMVPNLVVLGAMCVYLLRGSQRIEDRRLIVVVAAAVIVITGANDLLMDGGTIRSVHLADVGFTIAACAVSYVVSFRRLIHFRSVEREKEIKHLFIERAIDAQETERKRIARELHDATGQALTSMLVRLRAIEDTERFDEALADTSEVRAMARDALDNVKRMALGLHPIALDDLGLEEALRRYVDSFARTTGIEVDFHVSGMDDPAIVPQPAGIVLYRIAQEALTNVVKHANATSVSVVLAAKDERIQLIVEDDGVGFDDDSGLLYGFGRQSMKERAALCGGTVGFESRRGGGTSVFVGIPASS